MDVVLAFFGSNLTAGNPNKPVPPTGAISSSSLSSAAPEPNTEVGQRRARKRRRISEKKIY